MLAIVEGDSVERGLDARCKGAAGIIDAKRVISREI